MTESEFEKYSGNLRIKTICFDTLAQMWEGANDEYDPKVDEPLAKFYIGKVGKYSEFSYVTNKHLRCSSIVVTFANGYDVMVTPDDVEPTEEEMTWEEFLPKNNPVVAGTYKALSESAKEFADKTFLHLISGQHQLHNKDLRVLLDQAISMSIYREEMYSLSWETSWVKELDDE